jgi:membrane protease YdiL (CAAX protease family)
MLKVENLNSRLFAWHKRNSLSASVLFYALFLIGLAWVARYFEATQAFSATAILSFALLCAPYWFLGFGLDRFLIRVLDTPLKRLLAGALLIIPWLVFAIPRGQFQILMFSALLAAILAICGVLEWGRLHSAPHWCDWTALALLAFAVELPFFRNAWNAPGLSGASKLLFVDAGLFGFLIVRPIGGIGFHLRPKWIDLGIGLREFCIYTPIALALGFALGFLHLHAVGFPLAQLSASWLFTLFFVALPEEIFFRGLLLNLLQRLWGTRVALIVSALLFGLAHFPKRAVFNWRYVILAAIAGIFYGRGWLARRRVLSSGITHATVDAVWSVWFR